MSKIFQSNLNFSSLNLQAKQWRATCVLMAHEGKHGHLSSSLSCIDLLIILYKFWFKNLSKKNNIDKFIMSKGHGCTAQYVALADYQFIPMEELSQYSKKGGKLQCHPCKHLLPILEASTGSLGQGLGMATGMAYGKKLHEDEGRVVVIVGDGECNEGSVWEAAMLATAQKLDNLLVIVDYNSIQAVGRSDELMGQTDLGNKFKAFGWGIENINGNDFTEIIHSLDRFPFIPGKPSVIIAKTKTGISFMDNDILWHYRVPSKAEVKNAISELSAQPLHKLVI